MEFLLNSIAFNLKKAAAMVEQKMIPPDEGG
jgi:hypothetical protein